MQKMQETFSTGTTPASSGSRAAGAGSTAAADTKVAGAHTAPAVAFVKAAGAGTKLITNQVLRQQRQTSEEMKEGA